MIAEIGDRKVIIDVPDFDEKNGFNPVKKSVFSTDKLDDLGWKVEGSMMEKLKRTIVERNNNYVCIHFSFHHVFICYLIAARMTNQACMANVVRSP